MRRPWVRWTDEERAYLLGHPELSFEELRRAFVAEFGQYRTLDSIKNQVFRLKHGILPVGLAADGEAAAAEGETASRAAAVPTNAEQEAQFDQDLQHLVRTRAYSLMDLCNHFDRGPNAIEASVNRLKQAGYRIEIKHDEVHVPQPTAAGRVHIPLEHFRDGRYFRFGIVSDTHIGNKHARLDILRAAYDCFEAEGIREVFHCGNHIDGYSPKINAMDLVVPPRISSQIALFLQEYPHKPSIMTRYIDGDDHEAWFSHDTGVIPGRLIQMEAEQQGRYDLQYLGYMEADIPFKVDDDSQECIVRATHYKGGSSYADSYVVQKSVESFQSGEKPQVCLFGHYHKMGHFVYRNVDCVLAGCMEDQTTWARGKRLRYELGYWIITMLIDRDGTVKRFAPERFKFYDLQYYRNKYGPDDFDPLDTSSIVA